MHDDFHGQLQAAQAWARRAEANGWLDASDTAALDSLNDYSPASLFDDASHRPLVVALFGGTGAGKSTLLNRLAGQAIARTGVERPTSREVSLYLHESLSLQRLPEGFPIDRVRTASHHDESLRQVLWIDMPDIDSVETDNRDTVLAWLPHIDLLIYVVSPERYRDDSGWRLLLEQAQSHAWLFVMNHWDHGHPAQLDSFADLLRQGGFAAPLIFRTDSREPMEKRRPDDFDRLAHEVKTLADRHVIDQLASRSLALRRNNLTAALREVLARLGEPAQIDALPHRWADIWRDTSKNLLRGLEWPIQEVASGFVAREANPLDKADKLGEPATEHAERDSVLWDDWAAMELQDALDRLVLETDTELPIKPLRGALAKIAPKARHLMLTHARRGLRHTLAHPGGRVRRFFLRLSGLSAWLLPLMAMGWISWDVVNAFYRSEQTHSGYLGADFAIHASLLVAIAWLLPWFIHRQLKPSAEKTALQGLSHGVDAGLNAIDLVTREEIGRFRDDWLACVEEGRALLPVHEEADATMAAPGLDRLLWRSN